MSCPVVLRPRVTGRLPVDGREYNCFPIINRAFYRAVGYIAPVYGVDQWITEVSQRAGVEREVGIEVWHRPYEGVVSSGKVEDPMKSEVGRYLVQFGEMLKDEAVTRVKDDKRSDT